MLRESGAKVVWMAFSKNYVFFAFFFFPYAVGLVHALAYPVSFHSNRFFLLWTYNNTANKLIFNMSCRAAGWCAVGFPETAITISLLADSPRTLHILWRVTVAPKARLNHGLPGCKPGLTNQTFLLIVKQGLPDLTISAKSLVNQGFPGKSGKPGYSKNQENQTLTRLLKF